VKCSEAVRFDGLSGPAEALGEWESAAARAGLGREENRVMRLLAAEMISLTGELWKNGGGSLRLEREGSDCRLCLTAAAPTESSAGEVLDVPGGELESRIAALFGCLMAGWIPPDCCAALYEGFIHGEDRGKTVPLWSLTEYERSRPKEERPLFGGLADDLLLSLRDGRAEMTVRKRFPAPAVSGQLVQGGEGIAHLLPLGEQLV